MHCEDQLNCLSLAPELPLANVALFLNSFAAFMTPAPRLGDKASHSQTSIVKGPRRQQVLAFRRGRCCAASGLADRQHRKSALPRLRYFLLSKPIGWKLLADALLLSVLVDD
jgi:hypothetical protein